MAEPADRPQSERVLTQGFLYQGQLSPIAELNGSNQVVSRFVYGTRVNVPEYVIKGGTTYRVLTDHLGSVRLVVNASTGVIAQRLDYDEFGRVMGARTTLPRRAGSGSVCGPACPPSLAPSCRPGPSPWPL
jgi:hypothetical protein